MCQGWHTCTYKYFKHHFVFDCLSQILKLKFSSAKRALFWRRRCAGSWNFNMSSGSLLGIILKMLLFCSKSETENNLCPVTCEIAQTFLMSQNYLLLPLSRKEHRISITYCHIHVDTRVMWAWVWMSNSTQCNVSFFICINLSCFLFSKSVVLLYAHAWNLKM
jgi:hypothetical protein